MLIHRITGLCAFFFAFSTFAQVDWTLRNPLPQGNHLESITYGNSQYVTVGDYGTILTSGDGMIWTSRDTGTANTLYSIIYANSQYVAVGTAGTIRTSGDGITWTSRTGITGTLRSITFGNSQYVVAGSNGAILTSGDGITWTSRTSGTSNQINSITYGNSQYVAVNSAGNILTSGDGITWTSTTSGYTKNLHSIIYDNSQFVVVGDWPSAILTSSDGITWTNRDPGNLNVLYSITRGNSQYVAVGDGGIIQTSADGIAWTNRTGPATGLGSVACGNSQYVAVGDAGIILTSGNGITWTSRTSGTANGLLSVTYGSSQYVAVGDAGIILTSGDGIAWTSRTSGTTNGLSSITYGNSQYVASGWNGTILTSGDGITWTSRNSGTSNPLDEITYGNGLYVAVGYVTTDNGTILTSGDGITWTSRNSGITNGISSITYGDNQYVAVGGYTILTSGDGITWTSRTSAASNLLSIAYGNGQYVVVGLGGAILTSGDAITWTSRTSGTANHLASISCSNSQYVAVGQWGTILTSPMPGTIPLAPVLSSPGNSASDIAVNAAISWSASSGATSYSVQVSTVSDFLTPDISQSGLMSTSYTLSGLSNNTTYYWRVNASNTSGTSAWATPRSFTTIPTLTTIPGAIFPDSGAVDVPIAFSVYWYSVPNASSYHMQLSKASSFTVVLLDSGAIHDTLIPLSALANSTLYFWRVAAVNAAGQGAWSRTMQFTTICELPAAVVAIPAINDTLLIDTALCKWNTANLYVTKYQFQCYADPILAEVVISDSTITDTAFIFRDLSNNHTYWWRVRAKNAAGWGPFSDVRRLIVRMPETDALPSSFTIAFSGASFINGRVRYGIPQQCRVSLIAYDARGRSIRQYVSSQQSPGYYNVNLHSTPLAAGPVFLLFTAGDYARIFPTFNY
jgi:hypothetical protein